MRLLLVLGVCLGALAACGDSNDDVLTRKRGGIPGFDSNLPTGDDFKDMMETPGKIELTDEMMERYVALSGELKDVKTPSQAILARYKFDMRQWMALNVLIWGSQSRVMLEENRANIEKMLARAREQAKSGNDREKKRAASMIPAYEKQLEQMQAAGAATEIDRKNVEVLKRWQPKLKEVRRGR